MSHEIEANDKVISIEGKEWHGLAEYRPDLAETGIPFEESGTNHILAGTPIYARTLSGEEIALPSYKAVVCEDNNLVLSVVRDSYNIIQNSQIFETISESLVGINHKIVTSGTLQNRRKIFFSVELVEKQEYLANKEIFKNYLTFCSGHDGSMAFEAFDTSIRVVCMNTFNWSRGDKGLLNLKVYHTKNSQFKIRNMVKHIEELFEKREEFYKTYEGLCARPISLERAEQIVAGWITPVPAKNEDDKISTRSYNQVGEIINLFKSGIGNNGNDFGDLFNGATQYYTHEYTSDSQKRFVSNFAGSADNNKLDLFDTLQFDDAVLDKIAARGEKLLGEYIVA